MQETKTTSHVIVCRAYGVTDVYPATKSRAMEFFNQNKDSLPSEVKDIADSDCPTVRFVSARRMADAIREVFSLEDGKSSKSLRNVLYGWTSDPKVDSRPDVTVSPAWSTEVAMWVAKNGLIVGKVSAHDVVEKNALNELGMFAPLREGGREVRLVAYEDYFDMAHTYHTIVHDHFKPDASEPSMARYILNFVHNYLVDKSDWTILDVFAVQADAEA